MKIVLKKGCVVDGETCAKGASVNVEKQEDANYLIGMGNAVDAKDNDAVKAIKDEVAVDKKAA